MRWATTEDATAFLRTVTALLLREPVAHSPLLTEAGFLAARPATGALLGVLEDSGRPSAAFVHAPGHAVLLSALPAGAEAVGLPGLPALPWEVDGRDVDAIRSVLSRRGTPTRVSGRLALHTVADDVVPDPARIDAGGSARIADEGDRRLLTRWYSTLLGGLEGDATDLAFLVDEPLASGGAVLWERDGVARGVAVRTRPVAGVTKVTAAWSPDSSNYAAAAFVAATALARTEASTVVAVSRWGDESELLAAAGFRCSTERVLLDAVG